MWNDYIFAGSRRLAAAGTDDILNPGFEQGLEGWAIGASDASGTGQVITDPTRAHSGNNYMQLSTTTADDAAYNQVVAVNPGDQITFGGWGYIEPGSATAAGIGWVIGVLDANGNYLAFAAAHVTTPGAWTYLSANYTVPSGGASVLLYFQIFQPTGAITARCDDGFLTGASGQGVHYYHSDHLGSARLMTDFGGNVTWSATYLPFGQEWNPQATTNHYKFTGKERDSESGLDNFGARYNSSSLGRFMSADQLGPGQHPGNPQSWNLYSYVLNNPLKLVDPSGEFTCDAKTVSDQQCDHFQEILDKAQEAADKIGQTEGWDSKKYLDAQRAIDAYGDEGIDNGVVIAQGKTADDSSAQTVVVGATKTNYDPKTNPNGQNIWVILNAKDKVLNQDIRSVAALVAHEGVHVADGSDWVSSGFSNNSLPSSFQTEWDAYQVMGSIGEGLGAPTMTVPWRDRNYNFFLPLSPTSRTLTNMIKHEYPLYNLDAFSRNTKTPRP